MQGRIVAQAFLLSGAGVAAGYHFLHEGDAPKKEFGQGQSPRYNYKNFDLPKDEEGAEQAPASAKMQ